MRQNVVLVTGSAGEIGQALVERLADEASSAIVSLDLRPLGAATARRVTRHYSGSITDRELSQRILAEFAVDRIYHLAALLSTRSEFTPVAAHGVNVEGTLNLLEFALAQGRSHGRPVRFFYPSSIAVYGVPPGRKASLPPLEEHAWNVPITMYGCNKLYCEHLGRYYTAHYRQLDAQRGDIRVDFRCLRFPGLISASTVPSGGTSDFLPEMIHAAARSQPYACFVREDTQIPFMTMPDAIDAMLALTRADAGTLGRRVYNIASFRPTVGEFRAKVLDAFPSAEIRFEPDPARQGIVDSWPASLDDTPARRDWGFAPRHDLDGAFDEYLLPGIRRLLQR